MARRRLRSVLLSERSIQERRQPGLRLGRVRVDAFVRISAWFKVSNSAQTPLRAGSTHLESNPQAPTEGAMDNFIERLNIAHYLEQLKTVTDPIKREMLQLLVEERVKQVSHAKVEK
jgi:hypothetical protein